MKKSEIYRLAQCAVVNSMAITVDAKLEILRELMAKEDMYLFSEKQEEKGAESNA